MLDITLIRQAPEAFDQNIARRGLPPHADRILALDEQVRTLITQINTLQTQRNQASQQFRDADDAEVVKAQVVTLKAEIEKLEQQRQEVGNELHHLLITLPNMLMPEVPDGQSDADNVEIRRWGTPCIFTFPPKEHFDIGEQRQEMDFETAVKLSGSRFVVLKKGLARLHRALGQFMLDLHVYEHGFEEIDVPLMMRPESMAATTHLPKFDNGFRTEDGYWLIPSAEVPLINLYRDMILEPEQLPIRMTALTPCFRSEAGSAGRDTRGMLRHHQFYKVELVTITQTTGRTPRGIRNNNPGNIRRNGDPWQGLAERQGDVEFFTFKTIPIYGIRALARTLIAYQDKHGCVPSARSSVAGHLRSKTTPTLMCGPWWLIRGWMPINRSICIASIIFCRSPRRSSIMKTASSPIPMPRSQRHWYWRAWSRKRPACRKPAPSKADRPRQPPRRAWVWSRPSSRPLIPPVTR
jgi:seryl-tRNA synthetase